MNLLYRAPECKHSASSETCILRILSFRNRSCSIFSSMDGSGSSLLGPIELTIRCSSLWYLNENEILMTRTGAFVHFITE